MRINDKSFCGVQQRVGQKLHQTQLRDVAIAGALLIAGENPRDYGFDRISYTNTRQLNYSTVGFASDEDRAATRKKYDDFRATITVPEKAMSTPATE